MGLLLEFIENVMAVMLNDNIWKMVENLSGANPMPPLTWIVFREVLRQQRFLNVVEITALLKFTMGDRKSNPISWVRKRLEWLATQGFIRRSSHVIHYKYVWPRYDVDTYLDTHLHAYRVDAERRCWNQRPKVVEMFDVIKSTMERRQRQVLTNLTMTLPPTDDSQFACSQQEADWTKLVTANNSAGDNSLFCVDIGDLIRKVEMLARFLDSHNIVQTPIAPEADKEAMYTCPSCKGVYSCTTLMQAWAYGEDGYFCPDCRELGEVQILRPVAAEAPEPEHESVDRTTMASLAQFLQRMLDDLITKSTDPDGSTTLPRQATEIQMMSLNTRVREREHIDETFLLPGEYRMPIPDEFVIDGMLQAKHVDQGPEERPQDPVLLRQNSSQFEHTGYSMTLFPDLRSQAIAREKGDTDLPRWFRHPLGENTRSMGADSYERVEAATLERNREDAKRVGVTAARNDALTELLVAYVGAKQKFQPLLSQPLREAGQPAPHP